MEFIAKPFGWLLMTLYNFVGNYGLAVILFALIVKGITLPFQMKSKRSAMKQSRLQPRMKELEKKHGANKQKYQEEIAKMYREEKINPASGCLWNLLPLPIIIALFQAVSQPLTIMMGVAKELVAKGGAIYALAEKMGVPLATNYPQIAMAKFISEPENFGAFAPLSEALRQINYNFLGMKLGDTPQWKIWTLDWSDINVWGPGLLLFLLPIVSGVLSYFSARISMKMNPSMAMNSQQAGTGKSMMLMMPLISVYFAFVMPGAIGIYIIASTVFAMVQDIILTKHYTKILEAEEAVKLEQMRTREAELEAKRVETERKKLDNTTERNPNTSKKKQLKTERQEQLEKAVEWEKKQTGEKEEVDPSRIGERKFARGRAYDPTRFEQTQTADPVSDVISAQSEDMDEPEDMDELEESGDAADAANEDKAE